MFAIMENSVKKIQVEGGDKEILYSKTIKAGKSLGEMMKVLSSWE